MMANPELPKAKLTEGFFAMFDRQKEVTLKGTVKEFQWTNPHSFVDLTLDNQGGDYLIEGPTPGVLRAHGWKFNSLKAGDRVTAKVHPLREGKGGTDHETIRRERHLYDALYLYCGGDAKKLRRD